MQRCFLRVENMWLTKLVGLFLVCRSYCVVSLQYTFWPSKNVHFAKSWIGCCILYGKSRLVHLRAQSLIPVIGLATAPKIFPTYISHLNDAHNWALQASHHQSWWQARIRYVVSAAAVWWVAYTILCSWGPSRCSHESLGQWNPGAHRISRSTVAHIKRSEGLGMRETGRAQRTHTSCVGNIISGTPHTLMP